MSFYMPNLNMYTIDAIRQGIRTATTRYYSNEIKIIKGLSKGQPIRFIRTNTNKEIEDSIIVFAINNEVYDDPVGYKLPCLDQVDLAYWCELEGWDEAFAKKYFTSNEDKELWQFRYTLYPSNYNYSPEIITELKEDELFVFGSNTPNGRHGAGAAKLAVDKFGAVYGQAEGQQGNSYAIITTDLSKHYRPSVELQVVKDSVNKFLQEAINNPHLTFLVTEIGCGLAGFKVEDIAPLFKSVLLNKISNVRLPKSFVRHLIVSSINSLI